MYVVVRTLCGLISIYAWVIFIYVLLSWFPRTGVLGKIYDFLGQICEPYLQLFRKFIPPVGGGQGGMAVDFSPIVAFLALQLLEYIIRRILL